MTIDNAAHESTPAGPSTPREALDEFKKVQSRRVAHWKEYDEALEHYERTNVAADDAQQHAHQQLTGSSSGAAASTHRCGVSAHDAQPPGRSDHYHTVELPMTDSIFAKIVSLVTSGLLDCSHCVRAIETELRTQLGREDLASLVGKVQDIENRVLRTIVQRDQNRRIGKVEGRDMSESIAQANSDISSLRRDIQDSMEEINAEIADL